MGMAAFGSNPAVMRVMVLIQWGNFTAFFEEIFPVRAICSKSATS
jgi:hypothetical protein